MLPIVREIYGVNLSLLSWLIWLTLKKINSYLMFGRGSIILNLMNCNISFLIILLNISDSNVFLRVEPEASDLCELI